MGLQAYLPLYTASCLRNPATDAYCFADAITNTSSPTDSYIYYLPLNISLPGGTQPTCNQCLQDTMGVFETEASNTSSALHFDYQTAAMQVNVNCGPGYVNQTLGTAQVPNAAGAAAGFGGPQIVFGLMMAWAVGWVL